MGHFPSGMLQSAPNYLKAAEVLDAQNLSTLPKSMQHLGWKSAQELYFRT
jgi:hypothetical protein